MLRHGIEMPLATDLLFSVFFHSVSPCLRVRKFFFQRQGYIADQLFQSKCLVRAPTVDPVVSSAPTSNADIAFFNRIPTSFSLSDEQVDKLIAVGHELLRGNPDYQRFLADLGGARASGR